MTDVKKTIRELMDRDDKTLEWKISELERMHADARAAQRAGSESGMTADDDLEASLQEIDRALAVLGEEKTLHADETSAATL